MNDLNTYQTVDYKEHKIKIYYDVDPESPNNWGNDDVFLVYDHRQFNVERKGFAPREIFERIIETKKMNYEGYHVFTVYAYIHSGVSLSLGNSGYPFNDRWDVSTTGFILVKKQKGWSWKREVAQKIAESELKTWNEYLSGDVYGFVVEDGEGNETDSCWGFYGSEGRKAAITEAKSVIDYNVKEKTKSHLQKVKNWIKNKVPFINRTPLTFA